MRKMAILWTFCILCGGRAGAGTPVIPANGVYAPIPRNASIAFDEADGPGLRVLRVGYHYQRRELRVVLDRNGNGAADPAETERHHCLILRDDIGRKALARSDRYVYALWLDEDSGEFRFSVTRVADGRTRSLRMDRIGDWL